MPAIALLPEYSKCSTGSIDPPGRAAYTSMYHPIGPNRRTDQIDVAGPKRNPAIPTASPCQYINLTHIRRKSPERLVHLNASPSAGQKHEIASARQIRHGEDRAQKNRPSLAAQSWTSTGGDATARRTPQNSMTERMTCSSLNTDRMVL